MGNCGASFISPGRIGAAWPVDGGKCARADLILRQKLKMFVYLIEFCRFTHP
jgi:hypothetical protein